MRQVLRNRKWGKSSNLGWLERCSASSGYRVTPRKKLMCLGLGLVVLLAGQVLPFQPWGHCGLRVTKSKSAYCFVLRRKRFQIAWRNNWTDFPANQFRIHFLTNRHKETPKLILLFPRIRTIILSSVSLELKGTPWHHTSTHQSKLEFLKVSSDNNQYDVTSGTTKNKIRFLRGSKLKYI